MPRTLTRPAPNVGDFLIELRPTTNGDRFCLVEITAAPDANLRDILVHGYCTEAGAITEALGFRYRNNPVGVFMDERFYRDAPAARKAAA